MEKINLEELAKFLVKAKVNTYATIDKMKITPERLGFDELEYKEGDFYYRDSYCGFFQAPGMEIVRFKGNPIWTLAYSGGMLEGLQEDVKYANQVFTFLKDALKNVPVEIPFRGPENFTNDEWKYINKVEGNIVRFIGKEKILHQGREVFSQDYIGGIVIEK